MTYPPQGPYQSPPGYGSTPSPHFNQPPYYGEPPQGAAFGLPHNSSYSAAHPPRPSVSFGRAIKLFFKNYTQFYGRASKSEYWWTLLFAFLVELPGLLLFLGSYVFFIVELASSASQTAPVVNSDAFMIMILSGIMMSLVSLPLLLPRIAVTVRRLHDTGRSGWFYLISCIPAGGIILLVFLAADASPSGIQYDNPDGSQPMSQ